MNGTGMPHQSQVLLYGRHTLSYSSLRESASCTPNAILLQTRVQE